MQISALRDLTASEEEQLWAFFAETGATAPFLSPDAMRRALTGSQAGSGKTFLTAWTAEHQPAGFIGVVTESIPRRSEAFLHMLYAAAAEAQPAVAALIEAAYDLLRQVPGITPATAVHLGIRPDQARLRPWVEQAGFSAAYRVVVLKRPLADADLAWAPPAGLCFRPLGPADAAAYIQVHNDAFLTSPNGGVLDETELLADLAGLAHPDLMQVGYADDRPAIVLTAALDGRAGEIEALAVAPSHQGRGLGRAALCQALRTLRRHGAEAATLLVVETNSPAITLYQRNGFLFDRLYSTWFDGPPVR